MCVLVKMCECMLGGMRRWADEKRKGGWESDDEGDDVDLRTNRVAHFLDFAIFASDISFDWT